MELKFELERVDEAGAALDAIVLEVGIGGRLPSERLLAEQLGVSRTLVRDRLGLLESLGVIRRRPGAGTTVQDIDPSNLGRSLSLAIALGGHSTDSVQTVRVALERQAAREAALRSDHVEIARMRVAFDELVSAESDASAEKADFEFHLHLVRASGNRTLILLVDALSVALRRTFTERRKLLLPKLEHARDFERRTHGAILDAITSGDPDQAMKALDDCFAEFDRSVGRPAMPV